MFFTSFLCLTRSTRVISSDLFCIGVPDVAFTTLFVIVCAVWSPEPLVATVDAASESELESAEKSIEVVDAFGRTQQVQVDGGVSLGCMT